MTNDVAFEPTAGPINDRIHVAHNRPPLFPSGSGTKHHYCETGLLDLASTAFTRAAKRRGSTGF